MFKGGTGGGGIWVPLPWFGSYICWPGAVAEEGGGGSDVPEDAMIDQGNWSVVGIKLKQADRER